MPVKRRTTKRRFSSAAELKLWWDVFDIGHDFFGDVLEATGRDGYPLSGSPEAIRAHHAWIDEQHAKGHLAYRRSTPEEDADNAAAYEAAKEAWERLGETYLMSWPAGISVRAAPWALGAFGKPWEKGGGNAG